MTGKRQKVVLVFRILNILLVSSLGLLLLSYTAEGMSNGAPLAACPKLQPQHAGTNPSTDKSPYELHVEPSGNDGSMKLTINVTQADVVFKGFLFAVREAKDFAVDGSKLHGTFDVPEDSTLLHQQDCYSNPVEGVFVTHFGAGINPNLKKVEVVWHPPSATGRFKAQAVVVQKFTKYWIKIPSPEFDAGGGKVRVYPRGEVDTTPNAAYTVTVGGLSRMWMVLLSLGLFLV